MTVQEYNGIGQRLEQILGLRYAPIALQLHHEGDPLPTDTYRPWKDRQKHMAMCQAFAAVRRDREAITMLKEDHWCVWPLVSYGLVDIPPEQEEELGKHFFVQDQARSIRYFKEDYPRLRDKKAVGFSIAPLASCSFEPNLVTIYCRPAQIRSLQMAAKFATGEMLQLTLDPVDSCVHSTIPVLNGQQFNITFPDPGEYERALSDEDEVMFTVRADMLPPLLAALEVLAKAGFGYKQLKMDMPVDFPRPKFYNDAFASWGLATGPEWDK